MSDSSTLPRAITLRNIGGALSAVIALALLVLTLLAVADTGHLVVLRTWFGDPFVGAFLVLLFALVAVWLLLPVHSEAGNRGRARLRVTLVVLSILSLITALFVRGHWYVYDPQVVAHDPNGSGRVLAKVRQAGKGDPRALHVHIFSGSGLGARDLGDFGAPCGDFVAHFERADTVLVTSVYGDFHLHFNPATGAPIDHIGISCAAP